MNLIYGGSFEETIQPSGMFTLRGNPTAVVRDTGDRDGNGGSYSVKITSAGSNNEGIKAIFSGLKASTTYTVRVRAKATAGDTARIFTVGGSSNLNFTTTSTSWVSLYGTFTTDATPTPIVLILGSDNATDIVWFDMLILVEGQGAFTWTPYPGEILNVIQKHLYLNNAAFTKGNTAPAQVILGNYNGWEFDVGDDSVMIYDMPDDWIVGTDMVVKVCWYIDEGDASKYVEWQIAWSAIPHNFSEAVDSPGNSGTLQSGDIACNAAAKRLGDSVIGVIPGASLADHDALGFTLSRIAAAGDAPTAKPTAHHLQIEYQSNKRGDPVDVTTGTVGLVARLMVNHEDDESDLITRITVRANSSANLVSRVTVTSP